MKNKTCCLTGHRRLSVEEAKIVKAKLKHTLSEMIKAGYLYFGTGGALGFDTVAALTVLELKNEYPNIKLILVLPCVNQTKGWNKKNVEVYDYIKSKCDKCVYTSQEYVKGCMLKRNRHLVDNSSLCICYCKRNHGGTAYTVKYAIERGLKVTNLME